MREFSAMLLTALFTLVLWSCAPLSMTRQPDNFLDQSVSFTGTNVTVIDALSSIVGDETLKIRPSVYHVDGPEDFQNIKVDVNFQNVPLASAVREILAKGGNKYDFLFDKQTREVRFRVSERSQHELKQRYLQELAADRQFRVKLADDLLSTDEISVYLLDFGMGKGRGEDFPIAPFHRTTKILATKHVRGKQKQDMLRKLKEVLRSEDSLDQAMCHNPIHGLRVKRRGHKLFESSFCWECNNYYMNYPQGSSWVALPRIGVRETFEAILPIPSKELERFRKSLVQ